MTRVTAHANKPDPAKSTASHRLSLRLVLGLLVALAYAIASIVAMAPLGSGFTPDTQGYLELSPLRQPLYGLWANAVHNLSGAWIDVQRLQIAAFLLASAWLIVELCLVSRLGLIAAGLFVLTQLVLVRLGLFDIVGSLITEGLFYPFIIAMGAIFMAWQRTGAAVLAVAFVLVLVSMTQLRTAALLVVALPCIGALMALWRYGKRSSAGRTSLLILFSAIAALGLMPALTGKELFQVSTPSSTLGIVLIPRISLLEMPDDLKPRSPAWHAMSDSWRLAAANLDFIEVSQFDAQLQEAIRFDLAPKVLLPALLDMKPEELALGWGSELTHDAAKDLSIRWILARLPEYLRLSCAHMWGMLTMGNFMGAQQRAHVWEALQRVSPLTWQFAPFRTDFPLNRIFDPLSAPAQITYALLRYGSMIALVLGLACGLSVLVQLFRRAPVSNGALAMTLALAWVLMHSIPAALTLFPEFRYTYANFLALSLGAVVWLANVGTDPTLKQLSLASPSET